MPQMSAEEARRWIRETPDGGCPVSGCTRTGMRSTMGLLAHLEQKHGYVVRRAGPVDTVEAQAETETRAQVEGEAAAAALGRPETEAKVGTRSAEKQREIARAAGQALGRAHASEVRRAAVPAPEIRISEISKVPKVPNGEPSTNGWQVFRKGYRNPPGVSVYSTGVLAMNEPAFVLLGEPDAVELLFDPKQKLVGLRPADPAGRNSYRLHKYTGTQRQLSARAFLDFHDLRRYAGRRFDAELDGDVLVFALD